ncbi:terminase [Arthrobacter phage Abba]|uniref:Terminase n=1 Tax=Arthrobacter phage Abba TaxID=2713256 RepID=A0A6G8R2D9_9CAUD|nr:terminase large subunit [Arthrobacter phage Abba]QIN94331.1 terminase [Arthrobacter phage Abba]
MPKTVCYQYEPHPGPQTLAHHKLVDELLYGGAAGGGKSRFSRAEAVLMCLRVPGLRAIIFRRTFPDLERSVVEPLLQEIPKELGRYNSTKHLFRFHNGSILELGHLQRDADKLKYQGAEYQLIVFEEATHFTFKMYDFMRSRVRAGGPVADAMAKLGIRPRMILTANPGGIGHHWVKKTFIDPAPAGKVFRNKPTAREPRPKTKCYIPAKSSDNPSLDDSYIDTLNALSDNLRRAMRDGDWDVLEGVRFPDFSRQVHVIEPEELPIPVAGYPRAVGIDYGSSAPFAALWGAKLADDLIVVYRELYKPGLTPRQQAELIRDSEAPDERRPDRPIPLVLDPSMWARSMTQPGAKSTDPSVPPPGSIADSYRQVFGSYVRKARNERVGGWALLDEQMRVREDGFPRLLIYSNCVNLIRTLPAMPRDSVNPDDVDTHSEDHAPDALRYLVQDLVGRKQATPRTAVEQERARRRSTTLTGDLASLRS